MSPERGEDGEAVCDRILCLKVTLVAGTENSSHWSLGDHFEEEAVIQPPGTRGT